MIEEEPSNGFDVLGHLEFFDFGDSLHRNVLPNQFETRLRTNSTDSGVEIGTDHNGEVDELFVGYFVLVEQFLQDDFLGC